jgi:hypothetical protein
MSDLEKAESIAEKLRQEPYVLFRNDCIIKSRRLKKACLSIGIQARLRSAGLCPSKAVWTLASSACDSTDGGK